MPPPWRWVKSWRDWRCKVQRFLWISSLFKIGQLFFSFETKNTGANEQRLWRDMKIWREEFRIPIGRASWFSSWNLQNLDSGPAFSLSACVSDTQVTKERSWVAELLNSSSWIHASFLWFAAKVFGIRWLLDDYILDIHRSLLKCSVSVSRGKTRRWRFPGSWNEHGKFAPLGAIRVQKEWGLTVGKVTFWHWYLLSSDDNFAAIFTAETELILFMHSAWRGSRSSADWAANLINIGTVAHGFTEAQARDDGDGMETGLLVHWYAIVTWRILISDLT